MILRINRQEILHQLTSLMELEKHHRIAARISYLVIFLGVLYALFSYFKFGWALAALPLAASFFSVFSLWLLKHDHSVLPRVILSLSPLLLNSVYHASLVSVDDQIIVSLYISEFGMMLTPWVLFGYKERKVLSVCVSASVVIIICQFSLGMVLPDRKLPGQFFVGSYMDYMTYIFGVVLFFVIMYSFLHELYVQSERETRLMSKLRNYQRKIIKDNKKLFADQNKVTEINELLTMEVQDRAQRLEEQNKVLAEHSYINSHLLRAPLCRVISLVDLLDSEEDEQERKELIRLISESLEEMNELTIKISSSLEKRGYFEQYKIDFKQIQETLLKEDLKLKNIVPDK